MLVYYQVFMLSQITLWKLLPLLKGINELPKPITSYVRNTWVSCIRNVLIINITLCAEFILRRYWNGAIEIIPSGKQGPSYPMWMYTIMLTSSGLIMMPDFWIKDRDHDHPFWIWMLKCPYKFLMCGIFKKYEQQDCIILSTEFAKGFNQCISYCRSPCSPWPFGTICSQSLRFPGAIKDAVYQYWLQHQPPHKNDVYMLFNKDGISCMECEFMLISFELQLQ